MDSGSTFGASNSTRSTPDDNEIVVVRGGGGCRHGWIMNECGRAGLDTS